MLSPRQCALLPICQCAFCRLALLTCCPAILRLVLVWAVAVTLALPLLLDSLGPCALYVFTVSTCAFGLFTYHYVPETRSQPIESITAAIEAVEEW